MSKDHHKWRLGLPAPEIRAHSLAKHRVIEEYLKLYIATLTKNPRRPELKLTIVDAFAGGGEYTHWQTGLMCPGSPIISLNALSSAAHLAQQGRDNDFHLDAECFFVEKNKNAFNYLDRTVRKSQYSGLVNDTVHLFQGGIENNIDKILNRIKERRGGERAIFIMDQCGMKDANFPLLKKILSLKNAEVILTFATDWLIDYLNADKDSQRLVQKIGLVIPSKEIVEAKQHAHWRRLIQILLHPQFASIPGARYYTPFFIRSKDAHRDYWLVHLSGHARARDVMMGLHWQENTSFAHYGKAGFHMLGYNEDEDSTITGRPTLSNFYFDDTAESLCVSALHEQMPDMFREHPDGISFEAFFAKWTNTAPATSDIFKKAIRELAAERVLRITDKTGTVERQKGVQSGDDVIKRTRVKRLIH